jgi:AcrR family transcriptional regulator
MAESDTSSPLDAKTRILNAAIAQIDAHGEGSVRVLDIADAAEVTPALISHHFGSRDGLVAAAHAHRFETMLADDVAILFQVIEASTNRHDAASSLTASLTSVSSRHRAPNRLRRLSALAAAHGRPGLHIELSHTVAELIDAIAGLVELCQSKRIFRTELDARATATILLSMGLGAFAADLDATPATQRDLEAVACIIVESFYEPDIRSVGTPRTEPTVNDTDRDHPDIGASNTIESTDAGGQIESPSGSSDGTDSGDRILEAAINAIERDGDAALRVVSVADEAGVAPGMINYRFGSREGLVDAAQQERFRRLVGSGIRPFTDILSSQGTPEDKAKAYRLAFMTSVSRDRAATRLQRASSVATYQGRPDLQAKMSNNVTVFIDSGTQLIELGQQTGVFRTEIDARAAGTIVMGLGFGLIVSDFDARPASEDDLREVVGSLIRSLFPVR